MDTKKIESLSQKLEQLKTTEYECPGPTREVSEEVKNALEVALEEASQMTVLRCIELDCMACEVYDEHVARVDEMEEQLDALYEEEPSQRA